MAKRKQVMQTYGRHRKRVVVVEDPWADMAGPTRTRVFGSSFSDSSNSSHEASLQITRNQKKPPGNMKDENHQENLERSAVKRSTRTRKGKVFSFSDSSTNSELCDDFVNPGRRRVLRDRSNQMATTTGKQKTFSRRDKQEARKRQLRKGNTSRNDTGDFSQRELTTNFSELENYSLILSDSPAYKLRKASTRGKKSSGCEEEPRKFSLSTSTPHMPRNAKKLSTEAESSNLAHTVSPVCPGSIQSPVHSIMPSPVGDRSDIMSCSVRIEKLSISGLAASPATSNFGDLSHVSVDTQHSYHTCESHLDPGLGSKNTSLKHASVSSPHLADESKDKSLDHSEDRALRNIEKCSERLREIKLISPENDDDASFNLSQRMDTTNITHRSRRKTSSSSQDSSHNGMCLRNRQKADGKYNASASLFDDIASISDVGRVLRNGRVVDVTEQSDFNQWDAESEDDLSDIDENEEEMELSEIAEDSSEEEGTESESSDGEQNDEDVVSEESDEESAESDVSHSDSASEVPSAEATHYMLASENNSRNSSVNESDGRLENSTSNVFEEDDQSSSQKHTVSSHSDHSTSHVQSTPVMCTPRCKRPQLDRVIGDLDEACRSFQLVLTPVKLRQSGRVVTEREKVLKHCNQTQPCSFTECIPPSMMKTCVKIGEGVYGEVFRAVRNHQSVALKVIPIEGSFPVNDEAQKTFAEIISEIVISKELSALSTGKANQASNFVQVHRVSVVQGRYPDKLLKQWDAFHKAKLSENDRPDVFDDEQLFIVFEFEDAGCDLEGIKLESLTEAYSILHQVVLSLAIAEKALEFEHRDMHWGNVLVKRMAEESAGDYYLDGQSVTIAQHGVKVAIIDFTLSRLVKDGCCVFTDLSTDPTLFEGVGDYQFDIYRAMKDENSNEWASHHPYSNVLWVHYLADKLIKQKAYAAKDSREHKSLSRQFRTFLREALDYTSCMHMLLACPFFTENPLSH